MYVQYMYEYIVGTRPWTEEECENFEQGSFQKHIIASY